MMPYNRTAVNLVFRRHSQTAHNKNITFQSQIFGYGTVIIRLNKSSESF